MKNKSTLALMEQLIMVLVFALAAALCLQAFVRADRISRETEQRTRAAFLAQNAADAVKTCGGDLEAAAGLLGGTVVDGALQAEYAADTAFLLRITESAPPTPDLGAAEVRVSAGEKPLIILQTVWRAP